VTPERVLADTEVSELTAPGIAGEFGVLPEHVTFLGGLDTGVLSYTDAKGDKHELVVSGGYAEVLDDTVTVSLTAPNRPTKLTPRRQRANVTRPRRHSAIRRPIRQPPRLRCWRSSWPRRSWA
jgi:F-type H+-transporting ATPase subunit epsilon